VNKVNKLKALEKEQSSLILLQLGIEIGLKRDEAVKARRESGIEKIWKEDTEYYEGIDELTQSEQGWTKSRSVSGGLIQDSVRSSGGQCTAFFNIIRGFVDSATARASDILLPATEWNFDIKPTPISDMEELKSSVQAVVDGAGNPILKPDGTPHTVGEFVDSENQAAEKAVKKAKKHIEDDLAECHYKTELRKVIESSAKIGTGIIRGPIPTIRKARAVIDGALVIEDKVVPASKNVSPTNFFPHPDCMDNIQDGAYCFERDFLNAGQLRALIDARGYISSQIKKVLAEGPNKSHLDDGKLTKTKEKFEVWYFYGEVSKAEYCSCEKDDENEGEYRHVVAMLVNDSIIKANINEQKDGGFPYDLFPWQPRADSPFGIGVCRQGRVAQTMYNASARALMTNQGLSSAPMLAILAGILEPEDGVYELRGGKIWLVNEDEGVGKVNDAITSIDIPSYQAELTALMQTAQKLMEDSTGVNFLLQGQQGGAPDTVGGMELLHKNASAVLRRIARVFDERITEPHIRRYYEWILMHGKDDEKGDMQIIAVGSSVLVEQEIKAMQAQQILTMSLNPAYDLSPKKAAEQVLRAWRFEPSKLQMDDKERQAIVPQPAPTIQAAQIRAKSAEDIAQLKVHSDERKFIEKDDRETEYQQALNRRADDNAAEKNKELALKRELALLDYANKHQISIEKVKAEIAQTTMRLQMQERLSQSDKPKQVAKPAVEPVGKAPNGEAFEK